MLLKILAVVALVIFILVIVIALQPGEFRIARSTKISAPPPVVFAQVNDFRKWQTWNPWGKIDPAMKVSYEGAPAGVGAAYSWSGNNEVGEGRMTIIESRPHELIRVKLEFLKPFAATNTAEFTFKPEANETVTTWSMFGEKNFMAKAIHLFISMEKMIGGQFEKGLTDMKAAAEADAKRR
jgi:Polyketide cyclase / dehydrase and lipid transport